MRRTAGAAMLGLISAGLSAGATVSAATPGAGAPVAAATSQHCPKAESLVPRADWHHHRLGPGVTLAESRVHDRQGVVSMHVVRASLPRRALTVRPLMHQLTRRLPLTLLAAGHRHLVAAINTGYFDFVTGAPTGPIVVGGRPLVMSAAHQPVIGLNARKRMQSGDVWLAAHLSTPQHREPIRSVNELHPPAGLALYTPRWGARHVGLGQVARHIRPHGRIGPIGRHHNVRRRGDLLVARGPAALRALRRIGTGTVVHVHTAVRQSTRRPFRQAYGVGAEIVKRPSTPRSGFSCDSANTKTPARTAIGFADHGRTLVLVVVADHPHTRLHGLDNTQMSALMAQLGVSRAFDFDGSGSAEMLARLHRHARLSERNYPADGVQRPMPMGLGLFVR